MVRKTFENKRDDSSSWGKKAKVVDHLLAPLPFTTFFSVLIIAALLV